MFLSIDGFLEDPRSERQLALDSEYKSITHNELLYRGISLKNDKDHLEKIEKLFSCKLDKDASEVMYRRYLKHETNETYIHSDVLIGHYTGILFLSDPKDCSGGTAFWRHKKYGWERHPSVDRVQQQGLLNNKELWDSIYQDGFDESKWNLLGAAEMRFNRLVLFESDRYHSRYPMEAFGTKLDDSRLIKVFFCKVAP